jgi:hypothetical protein
MNRFSLLSTMLAAFLATAPGTSIAQPAAAKPPLSHEALFLMERVGSPAVSPDGKWVVFPVSVPAYDEKNETADRPQAERATGAISPTGWRPRPRATGAW